MNILFATSELAPWAQSGGLGDVASALGHALCRRGHCVRVVVPRYGWLDMEALGARRLPTVLTTRMGPVDYHSSVWHLRQESGLEVFFIEHDSHYARASLYGGHGGDYPDNDVRFGHLSRAAIALTRQLRWMPDVVHVHDWQTALASWICARELGGLYRSVLTVHNMGYQGHFGAGSLPWLGLKSSDWESGDLEFWGRLALLKIGVLTADHVTTVSPTYAQEVRYDESKGFGLSGILRARGDRFTGILNGVDYTVWNPATDPHLPANYSPDDLRGKARCRAALLERLGLRTDLDGPVIGIVSRLAWQKGIDLLLESTPYWLGSTDAQFVAVGTGSPELEAGLRGLAHLFPGRVGVHLSYSNEMAHLVEAGSDIFLMPSRYEPCGLNQMYSLKYGTPPVVRHTGGLADTVVPVDDSGETGTGFAFKTFGPAHFGIEIRRAIALYRDRALWRGLMRRGMAEDFSWDRSAEQYLDVYRSVGADDATRVEAA